MPTRNFRLAIAAALLIGLSACESLGPMSSPKVAERDPDNPQTASANISSLSDVIERRPNDPIAFNQRGIAYARNGDYQEAIADFSSAVKLNGKFAEAYTNRALAYRQIEKDDQALADFNAAIVANPNYAPAFLGRGNLLRTHAHYDDAMADLNAAIRLKPEDAQAYHARGLIYQRQGDCVRAITDFNNAIDRDPFVEAPYEARGQCLVAAGKYDAAIEDFNAALNVNNHNADSWANLGVAYEKQGNKSKAVEILQSGDGSRPAERTRPRGVAPARLNRLYTNSIKVIS